jgi:hypothetical protein
VSLARRKSSDPAAARDALILGIARRCFFLEPLWCETGEGQGTTLIATKAGLEAIGIELVAASTTTGRRRAKPKTGAEPSPTTPTTGVPKFPAIRAGTKQAQIIALLQRPEGATITEFVEATSWQAYTARGAIAGARRRSLACPSSP